MAEKRVVNILKELGIESYRHGIFGGTDVYAIIGNKKFSIEVKTRKSLAFIKWLEQAVNNASENEIPIVFCTAYHSKKWFVILELKDFISLLKEESK